MRAAALTLLPCAPAWAQTPLPSSISILVGFGPAQGNDQPARPDASTLASNRMSPDMSYDQTARYLARHLGRFLPGQPAVRAQHAPGAVGLTAARALTNAYADGSVVALLSTNVIFGAALRLAGVDAPVDRLVWLGGVAPDAWACIRTASSRMSRPWAGSLGPGTRGDIHARALREAGHYPMDIASGYSSRFELMRALENGEIDMACGWPMNDLLRRRGEWIASERMDVVALFSQTRHGLTQPRANATAASEAIFSALALEAAIAWPLAAPPGMSDALADLFRQALKRLPQDQQAATDAARAGVDLNPVDAKAVERNVRELFDLDDATRGALISLMRPIEPSSGQR